MTFKRISVSDSSQHIQDHPNSVIIDIRDPDSFSNGHMPNAILMNNDIVQDFIKQTDKTAPLFVCCYHGNSSQGAAGFFAEQGFEEVYSIDGGFEEWKLSQPTES